MSFRRSITRYLSLLSLLSAALVASLPMHAQTFRGGINGVVTDQAGAAIPSAPVQALDEATGILHETVSSSAGEYTFQDLPPGSYTVSTAMAGFQKLKVDKVMVSAGQIYSLPLRLAVASQATTVEVSAAAYTLDTTTVTQTTVVGAKQVDDMPLNGRDFTQLIALTPGFAGYVGGGYGSMNGTRANQMNWQIDGIDNNDLWHNIPAVNQGGVSGIAGIILPIDAVDQFSAQTQSSPETGRNPGGTINLGLKSGTNNLHGSIYYFNRNEALGAKSPFSAVKQKVRNYNYGFSVGAPIMHDKLFGFVTFEKQRFVIGQSGNATEPSLAWQQKATAILNNAGVAVNPVATNLLNTLWPAYALTGGAVTNNYHSSDPEFGYSYNGLAKVDYHITDKDTLTAHWFVGQGNQVAPVGSQLLYYYEVAPIHVQNYAIVYNRVLSPSMTNQVLAGVNYFNQVFNDNKTGFNLPATGLVTGAPYTNAPNIKITNFDPIGQTPPEGRNDITGHLTDAFSWTFGKHQLRFGGEFRQAQLDEFYHRHAVGTFKFDGTQGSWDRDANGNLLTGREYALADFMAGAYSSSSIAIGDPERQVFVNTFDLFVQDSYQVTPKLNVNYGLRYDYEGPLHNGQKDLSVFVPSKGGLVFQGASIGSVYKRDLTNFSPRVGLAYQIAPTMVVRAGAGWYYDTPNLNPFLDNRPGNNAPNGLEGNPGGPSPVFTVSRPAGVISSGQAVFPTSLATSPCVVTTDNVSPCGVFSVDQNFKTPYNLNYNLQLEQSLSPNVIAQLGYVGSQGRHLLSILDINQAALQPTGSPSTTAQSYAQQSSRPYFANFPTYGNINQIESIGTSNYNSLQATLRISNYHRLQSQLSYTWSHNLDVVSAYRGALPQDSTNFKGDYGNSDFDTRHTFVGFFSYEVPGSSHGPRMLSNGWQLNSLLSFHGGQPFSMFADSDSSGTDEGVQRANQVMRNPYAGFKQEKANGVWLNPDAFANPAPGTFGTSRRNQYYGPGYGDVDLSVFKNTQLLHERLNVQFRAEMFNLLNRTNFAPPVSSFSPSYDTVSSGHTLYDTIGDFNGAPGIGAGEAFNTQLGLKITF